MLKPEEVDARILENRLRRAEREGAFLILTASATHLDAAEAQLLARFDLERRDLNKVFLSAMREQAVKSKADWNVVLDAHNAAPDSRGAQNLMILVGRSMPEIERQLSASNKTLLLVNSDVLTQYGRIDLLERLRDRVWSTNNELHGVWALMKRDNSEYSIPSDNMRALACFRNQLTHVPENWIARR